MGELNLVLDGQILIEEYDDDGKLMSSEPIDAETVLKLLLYELEKALLETLENHNAQTKTQEAEGLADSNDAGAHEARPDEG